MNSLKVVVHPGRLKIIQELLHGKKLTGLEIANRIKEIPQATVYRHIQLMEQYGIIKLVQEKQVKGKAEKVYTLKEEDFTSGDLDHISEDEKLVLLVIFLAGVLENLKKSDGENFRGKTIFKRDTFHFTDEKIAAFINDYNSLIEKYSNESLSSKSPRSVSVSSVFLAKVRK